VYAATVDSLLLLRAAASTCNSQAQTPCQLAESVPGVLSSRSVARFAGVPVAAVQSLEERLRQEQLSRQSLLQASAPCSRAGLVVQGSTQEKSAAGVLRMYYAARVVQGQQNPQAVDSVLWSRVLLVQRDVICRCRPTRSATLR
jgi:uncharacterized membrane protein